jgi:hypothetical protein
MTPAGQFVKPLPSEQGVDLVYVDAKELRKRPDSAALKHNIEQTLDSRSRDPIFGVWFDQRKAEAKLNADPLLRIGSSARRS